MTIKRQPARGRQRAGRNVKIGKPKPTSRVLKPRSSGAGPKAKHHLGAGKPKPTSLVLKPRSSGAGPKAKHHKGIKKAKAKTPGRRKSAMDIMSGAKKSA